MTLTFSRRLARVVTHTHTNIEFKGQSVQKIEWKQTDGQTGGDTDSVAFPANAVGNYICNKAWSRSSSMACNTAVRLDAVSAWRTPGPPSRWYNSTAARRRRGLLQRLTDSLQWRRSGACWMMMLGGIEKKKLQSWYRPVGSVLRDCKAIQYIQYK